MSNLEQFNYIQFKTVMNVSDVDEATYGLILRAIFANLEVQHTIIIDELQEVTSDFVYAVYRHAKFIFDTYKGNLDTIKSTSDSSGNRTTYEVKIPMDIRAVYKMHSPEPAAYL